MKRKIFIFVCLLCQVYAPAQLNTDRILSIGRNAHDFGDYVLSIQYFNQVIRIKPNLAEPYMYRASSKIQLGDFQGADQDCSEALSRNPFLHWAYYLRGFARKRTGNFYEASNDFTKALEFKPNDPAYLMNRIEAYGYDRKYNEAITDLDLLLKLYPSKHDWLYNKGNYQLQLNDTLGAEKTYSKLIELNNKSWMGWSARGLVKMIKKDNEGALKDYNEAVKRNSTFAGDYVNRGNLNKEKKNYKQALIDYDIAIKYDSTEFLAYFNRGLLREYLGDKNNALNDFKKVIQYDSTKMEAVLQKAIIEKSLGNYKNAIEDYKTIINRYPYFIPAYHDIADAEEALGNKKTAFYYLQKAHSIEQNKDYYKQKEKEKLVTGNQMVKSGQKSNLGEKNKLFFQIAMQNNADSITDINDNKYAKGNVQDKFSNLTNEDNFILSFITYKYQLRRTNLYHPEIDKYNKLKVIPATLGISNIESTLSSELANFYFNVINISTDSLLKDNSNANIYFGRALEFAAIQDYIGAIDDLNKVIELRPGYMLAYFSRANIMNKLIEKNALESNITSEPKPKNLLTTELNTYDIAKSKFNIKMILGDYEKTIELSPDFAFAYYNMANIMCTQKDFKNAILNYSKSIVLDPDFAEAYFNRGLTYLYLSNEAAGLSDLSKAGELGIYKAYNLIQRFKK